MDDRLPTDLWVRAHIRQCIVDGIPATVAHKGDPHGGTVLLKLNRLEAGCRLLSQVRDLDGRMGWMAAGGGQSLSDAEADQYIARAVARDPDLWVIEIEDRKGRNPFGGREL